MTNPQAHDLERFDREGYVVLERVLGPGELSELVAALAPFEAGRPMGRNDFEGERSQRVYSLAGKGAPFLRLAEHPSVLAVVEARLLRGFLLSTFQSIRLHPGENAQAWHTDDAFYLSPRPRATLGVSAIWAIEDFTEDNGATELIPGSHRWGGEHPDDRPHDVVKAVMPAGSVVLFDAGLWHRGGANASAGTRLAISPQYCQPWLRPQESQLLVVPPERARGCSARVLSMLGYSIHPPFIGQVDGMHPLRLVDPEYRAHKTHDRSVADRVLERPVAEMKDGEGREPDRGS
jgi:ectoine hydroxylase-related dioxygenase (phytanoyl-CoA dioxygenase family)